jgi:hypothetical protein
MYRASNNYVCLHVGEPPAEGLLGTYCASCTLWLADIFHAHMLNECI